MYQLLHPTAIKLFAIKQTQLTLTPGISEELALARWVRLRRSSRRGCGSPSCAQVTPPPRTQGAARPPPMVKPPISHVSGPTEKHPWGSPGRRGGGREVPVVWGGCRARCGAAGPAVAQPFVVGLGGGALAAGSEGGRGRGAVAPPLRPPPAGTCLPPGRELAPGAERLPRAAGDRGDSPASPLCGASPLRAAAGAPGSARHTPGRVRPLRGQRGGDSPLSLSPCLAPASRSGQDGGPGQRGAAAAAAVPLSGLAAGWPGLAERWQVSAGAVSPAGSWGRAALPEGSSARGSAAPGETLPGVGCEGHRGAVGPSPARSRGEPGRHPWASAGHPAGSGALRQRRNLSLPRGTAAAGAGQVRDRLPVTAFAERTSRTKHAFPVCPKANCSRLSLLYIQASFQAISFRAGILGVDASTMILFLYEFFQVCQHL